MKLTPELANKIVNDYGAVLAENSQDVISERLLPYEKKIIADAIKYSIVLSFDIEDIEILKSGYCYLSKFVTEEEAQQNDEYDEIILNHDLNLDAVKDILSKLGNLDSEMWLEIKKQKAVEMQRLLLEINDFVEKVYEVRKEQGIE